MAASAERVHARLCEVLTERKTLSIGVARQRLVIEGESTDDSHPILRDLATLLHRQQIGALVLTDGVEREELSDVLNTLGSDAAHHANSDGAVSMLSLEGRWPHVQFFRMSFDRLQLGTTDGSDEAAETGRVNELWRGLARAALAGDSFDDSGRFLGDAEHIPAPLIKGATKLRATSSRDTFSSWHRSWTRPGRGVTPRSGNGSDLLGTSTGKRWSACCRWAVTLASGGVRAARHIDHGGTGGRSICCAAPAQRRAAASRARCCDCCPSSLVMRRKATSGDGFDAELREHVRAS